VEGLKLFALYESCFPVFISIGVPIRHHIVVYYHCKVGKISLEQFRIERDEVDMVSWLSKKEVEKALFVRISFPFIFSSFSLTSLLGNSPVDHATTHFKY